MKISVVDLSGEDLGSRQFVAFYLEVDLAKLTIGLHLYLPVCQEFVAFCLEVDLHKLIIGSSDTVHLPTGQEFVPFYLEVISLN